MPKRTEVSLSPARMFVLVLAPLLVCGAAACAKATPPPLTPDGPEMDLDASVYQDDAPAL